MLRRLKQTAAEDEQVGVEQVEQDAGSDADVLRPLPEQRSSLLASRLRCLDERLERAARPNEAGLACAFEHGDVAGQRREAVAAPATTRGSGRDQQNP